MRMLTEVRDKTDMNRAEQSWLKRALRVEWLGQMMASLFWIGSVLVYGISAAGDWLQLFAASAWFVANVAALLTPETTGN